MTSTGFYRAFEERHRGPRDLIKQRLVAYLPFIAPLLQLYEPAAAIDLGCGRGEWLELLQEKGFLPQGVDLDEDMLEACKARGLPATQGDAIAYLKSLADATQCIVSGFHIAEHIAFDDLETLVIEALRVLKPGGLLILETPNPENIVVGTSSFYLDPTHLRPIPPLLLSFLPEQYGYERVKILRLQESPDLATRNDIGLFEVLGGVSPDYAVVAQKVAEPATLELFSVAFGTRYGIELNDLASRYDEKVSQRMAALDQRIEAVEGKALAAEARAQEQENRALAAEARAQEQETEKNTLRQSWSWRITAPVRYVGGVTIHAVSRLRNATNHTAHLSINALQRPLAVMMRAVLRRPGLSYRLNQYLLRYPALHQRLLGVARSKGVMPGMSTYVTSRPPSTMPETEALDHLTPHARQIYRDLKAVIESRQKENG